MKESQIKNMLSKLSNDSAKLLYLINFIYENGKINHLQKIKLKVLLCQGKDLVFNLLKDYKNINNFINMAQLIVINSENKKAQTKNNLQKTIINVLTKEQIKNNSYKIKTKIYDIGRNDGEFINKKQEGKEKFYHRNTELYRGECSTDKSERKVINYFKNDDRYERDYKNDRNDRKGLYYYNDGDRYEGDFNNGSREGKGIYYFKNGDRYEGD